MNSKRDLRRGWRSVGACLAVTFLDAEPSGIPKFSGTEPAGCSFWRLAAAGRTFYTVPADHFNCAVGAYSTASSYRPIAFKEGETMLGMMFNLGYVKPEEIPGIPRLSKEPAAVVFAPLGDAPVAPSVVIFALKAPAAMLHGMKPPSAPAPAARCRCLAGRRAWRFPRRSHTEPFRPWAASGIACTPIWARTKCMLWCPARNSKPSPTRWESSQPQMQRWKNLRAGGRLRCLRFR